MIVPALKCLTCGSVVWSKHRRDFCTCACGACFVDGGREYTRCGAEDLTKIKTGTLDTTINLFSEEDSISEGQETHNGD